jgi:hypothetical protein
MGAFFSTFTFFDSLDRDTELSLRWLDVIHGEFPCFQGQGVYNKGSPLTTTLFCKYLRIYSKTELWRWWAMESPVGKAHRAVSLVEELTARPRAFGLLW